ncbi:MAG: PQQ-like beta-propeller repeat protein [Planctomycetota bacterium]|nr:PQQ-like beta-propeller repeat protein [Planctomycetota bacterium]
MRCILPLLAALALAATLAASENLPKTKAAEAVRKDWSGGLTPAWTSEELCPGDPLLNGSTSSPAVADGVVVAMGRSDDKDLIFAFEAETGKALWKKEVATNSNKTWKGLGNGARATPAIGGGCVYTLGAYGHLACWDLKTGEQKWLVETLKESKTGIPYWGVCGSPVLYGETVLVKVGGYGQGPQAPLVMAFHAKDGSVAWKSPNAVGSWAPLSIRALGGKDCLFAWSSDGLRGLDPATGAFQWHIPWKTAYDCHATEPLADGARLFVTSGYGVGCQAFELKDGKPNALWPVSKAVSSCSSAAAVRDGCVYSFSGNGKDGSLVCLDWQTGEVKWTTKEFGNGSLLLIGDVLLCLGYQGKLGLVEAAPGAYKKLGEMQVFDAKEPAYAAPAYANGKAYVRYNGKLACYDLTK